MEIMNEKLWNSRPIVWEKEGFPHKILKIDDMNFEIIELSEITARKDSEVARKGETRKEWVSTGSDFHGSLQAAMRKVLEKAIAIKMIEDCKDLQAIIKEFRNFEHSFGLVLRRQ